jgi:pimeloyl-ACP methyl ester carboxylesterase
MLNIILIGHSIGAFVAFAAAKRAGLAAGKIGDMPARAIGLMPYLENNELPELKAKVREGVRGGGREEWVGRVG